MKLSYTLSFFLYFVFHGHIMAQRMDYREENEKDKHGKYILDNYDKSVYSIKNYNHGKREGVWIINRRDSTKSISMYKSDTLRRIVVLAYNGDTLKDQSHTYVYFADKTMHELIRKRDVDQMYLYVRDTLTREIQTDKKRDTLEDIRYIYYYAENKLNVYEKYKKNNLAKRIYYGYQGKDSMIEAPDSMGILQKVIALPNKKPAFIGGSEAFSSFVQDGIRYPKEARKSGIQGSVIVAFVVEKDGSVTKVKVQEGPSQELSLEQEAVRLIRSSKPWQWEPAEVNGQRVASHCVVAITFELED